MPSREATLIDALYRISSLVGGAMDDRAALEVVVDEIIAIMPANAASIELIDPDTRELKIEVVRGLPASSKEMNLRLGQGITGWVALHGKPRLVNDVLAEPQYIPISPAVRSELAVPMRGADDEIIGVVTIDSHQVQAFTEQDVKILTLMTNEATRSVEKIWLIQRLRDKAAQLESLVNTSRSLVQKRTLEGLLGSVTGEARNILDCPLGTVLLYDQETDHLVLHAMNSPQRLPNYEERLSPADTALGTVLKRQKSLQINQLARVEEHHLVPLVQKLGLVSLLAAPMVFEGQTVGVLVVYSDRPRRFSDEEKRLLQSLADLSAISLQNARLYDRIFQNEEYLRKTERLTTLGLLAAEIAHEIRNPLTVIRLLFDSLDLSFEETDLRARDVHVIGEKLTQLEAIVTRVLSFSKSRENLRARYQLSDLVADTLLLLRPKLQQGRVTVNDATAAHPVTVEVHKGQIQQAILNVLINALNAMPEGGEVFLDLSTDEVEAGQVALDIRDTGKGVPKELQARIFETFLSGNNQGTGLGLSITKRILESHDGSIALRASSPETGTTIRLILPVQG